MHKWRNLLGGLLLWAAHFFAVYVIGSVFPGKKIGAMLVLATSLAILAITLMLAVRAFRATPSMHDGLQRWMSDLSLLGYSIATVAIIYQSLPAIFL